MSRLYGPIDTAITKRLGQKIETTGTQAMWAELEAGGIEMVREMYYDRLRPWRAWNGRPESLVDPIPKIEAFLTEIGIPDYPDIMFGE